MTCQHCGAALPPIAMFCGECGRSVTAAQPPPIVRPSVPPAEPRAEPEPEPEPELELELELEPEPALSSVPPQEACPRCETPAEPEDLYCAECGTVLESRTRVIENLDEGAVGTHRDGVDGGVDDHLGGDLAEESEATGTEDEHRFVLQFSTGESVMVTGSGLAGRHPRAEPGEFVDHLVTILDPGRSVSKTHFEFGHEQGGFWFSDRHSGNGSVIREPGADPRLCEPGRRYRIVRGTRIDIGEQFVVVS